MDNYDKNEQTENTEKTNLERMAPIGLAVGLISLVYTAGYYFVRRELDFNVQVGLSLVIIGVAFYMLVDPSRFKAVFSGRQARYSSNAIILSVAMLGILVVLNKIVDLKPKTWDWTEDKVNSLADQSLDILDQISEPITVTAFYSSDASFSVESAKDMLDKYVEASNGLISYEFVDPVVEPIAAQTAEITSDQTIVFWLGNRKEMVTFVSENEFTGAILRLISTEDRVVYFLTGHGEYPIDEFGDDSYQSAVTVLETKGYTVESLNLLAQFAIPEDASALVVAGPLTPLQGEEVALIANYLQEGGGVIYMTDPPITIQGYLDTQDPMVDYLADAWGIQLQNDVVLDLQTQGGLGVVANSYANHLITQKMEGVFTVFPTVRSVQLGEPVAGVNVQELILTSPEVTWAETDMVGLIEGNAAEPDDNDDLGPVSIAVVGENAFLEGRIVVFGDSEFPTNQVFSIRRNGDMFINAVDWVAEQEDLINLNPRQNQMRFLNLLPEQVSMLRLFAIYILPGGIAGIGVWVYTVRRRRT